MFMQNLRQNRRHFYFFAAVFSMFLFIKTQYANKFKSYIFGVYSYTNVQIFIKICKDVIDIKLAKKNCVPPIFRRKNL